MRKLFTRAQVSIFVIIAIIFVFLGIFIVFLSSENISIWDDETSSYKIKNYVETCLDSETREGVRQIALHGGWLYTPFRGINFVNKDTNRFLIKSSRGMDLFGVNIPYWYYYDDANDQFKLNIPEFDGDGKYSMRNQLEDYLDINLNKNCLRNFEPFEDIYDINYNFDELSTEVVFKGDEIRVILDWPLEINELNTNSSESISKFIISKENKLRTPYYLAKDIILAEADSSFVEKRIIQYITPYQSTEGRDLLPPFYDMKMQYDFKPWYIPDVEDLTKKIVSSNIRHIQFFGTKTGVQDLPEELKDNSFAKSFYNNYNKDYLTESRIKAEVPEDVILDYENFRVDTISEYFYPMFFSISPSFGDIILLPRPEAAISLIPFFFTEYVSVYEITAPIHFKIKNTQNPNDKFEFNLFFESNIDHNTPLRENKVLNLDLDLLDGDEAKSLICDPPQFISDYITLNISDRIDNGNIKDLVNDFEVGVDGAIVTFDCKGLSSCYVGETEINGKYRAKNISFLKFRLPINCNPGTLEIYKYGHKKFRFENLDPQIGTAIDLGHIYMDSKKSFNIKLKKITPDASRRSAGASITDNEQGFLIISNLDDSDLIEVIEFNAVNQRNLSISLIPGNYSFQGFLMYNKSFTIPGESICYSKGLFSSEECEELPAIDFDSWIRGGIEIENMEITLPMMFRSEDIYINIVDYGVPRSYADLTALSDVMGDLKGLSYSKEPYFE